MNDISDEGQPVLEISHPGTSAERNELNRQTCQARDSFIPAYRTMVNLLNRKNLLPPASLSPDALPRQAGPERHRPRAAMRHA
ncbi:hypothetical protein [Streptomyces sp. C8S0]|uniref:hypothetical protein n=1 Tax=Streptomyces sp. C8S0 TaxID=2585716 RepID=UPI00125D2CC3|nr:hypothetical protein [Streptomyces sp. C8S0]